MTSGGSRRQAAAPLAGPVGRARLGDWPAYTAAGGRVPDVGEPSTDLGRAEAEWLKDHPK